MGKAYRAPAPTYQRQFVISHHAVQRFRERVEEEHAARPDFDIANLLDERIRHANKHQTVIDTRNIDSVTRVFELESRDGEIYYAVVRDQTVVTVLDEKMLRSNFDNGSWKTGPMNMPFTRQSLRGVVPEVSAIARSGPPPGVPSVPVGKAPQNIEQLVEQLKNKIDATNPIICVDPVSDAGVALGAAMVAHKAAQAEVLAIEDRLAELELERQRAEERMDAAAEAVKTAQVNLADAVEELNINPAQSATIKKGPRK